MRHKTYLRFLILFNVMVLGGKTKHRYFAYSSLTSLPFLSFGTLLPGRITYGEILCTLTLESDYEKSLTLSIQAMEGDQSVTMVQQCFPPVLQLLHPLSLLQLNSWQWSEVTHC